MRMYTLYFREYRWITIYDILSLVEKQIKTNIKFKKLLNIFKRLYESFVLYDLILLTY